MEQAEKNLYADTIVESIGVMVVEDRPALLDMLQRNGSLVSDDSTDEEIIDASIKAIKDNKNFRKEIQDYLTIVLESEDDGSNSEFSNAKGEGWKKVKTGLGSFGKQLFSKENISAYIGLGMGYLGARLQNNAQKSSNQQAIEYEKAKAEAAAQEARRLEQEGLLAQMKTPFVDSSGKTKGWVLPVAIIGGVAVIGTILYFVLRKRQ
jgi:hypothetical protein